MTPRTVTLELKFTILTRGATRLGHKVLSSGIQYASKISKIRIHLASNDIFHLMLLTIVEISRDLNGNAL